MPSAPNGSGVFGFVCKLWLKLFKESASRSLQPKALETVSMIGRGMALFPLSSYSLITQSPHHGLLGSRKTILQIVNASQRKKKSLPHGLHHNALLLGSTELVLSWNYRENNEHNEITSQQKQNINERWMKGGVLP